MKTITWGSMLLERSWIVNDTIPTGFCRVYYIEGGDVCYADDRNKIQLNPQSIYIFPSHKPYQITHNPDNPLQCTWLHISLFPHILTELISIKNVQDYIQLFELIKTQCMTRTHVDSIMEKMAELFVQMCYLDNYLTLPETHMLTITEYIRTHLHEPINISDISTKFGYSDEYFIRYFKKHIGITPYQFLINSRLDMACAYLREGTQVGTSQSPKSIEEIAMLVGYKDIKTFNHAFKQNFDKTPTEYRKTYRYYI